MFIFKFLSFCLGSATLGGTGAAIYCAIASKKNGQKDEDRKEVKLKVEGAGSEQVHKETVQSKEPPQQEPSLPPSSMVLVEVGEEESSTSQNK